MKKATIKLLSFIICGAMLFSGMFGAYAVDSAGARSVVEKWAKKNLA